MSGEGAVLALGMVIGIVGALMLVFGGIVPPMNGAEVNMPVTFFGVVLIIVAVTMEALAIRS
ncbi:MAG: hypothetical protein ABSA75_13165 [Candidatus Bathyarchaeia archaeon]|jgi:hypothetical protein